MVYNDLLGAKETVYTNVLKLVAMYRKAIFEVHDTTEITWKGRVTKERVFCVTRVGRACELQRHPTTEERVSLWVFLL